MSNATKTSDTDQALRQILQPRDEGSLPVPVQDILDEIRSRVRSEPSTISVLAARDVQQAAAAATALQEASIRLTMLEDWVAFPAKDGAVLCYLQDAGCQRVRILWGISFAKFDPRTDLAGEEIAGPGGHYAVEAYVEATCAITGETIQEIGHRDSAGLFERAWLAAREGEQEVTLAKLRSDVRKSAIANGQGRAVRRATGLSAVPAHRVCALLGVKPEQLRGIRFEQGSRGGGGTGGGASDPQILTIVKNAFDFHKVKGLGELIGREAFEKLVRGAGLTGGKTGTASAAIDALMKAPRDSVGVEQLEKLLSVKIGGAPAAPREREPGEE
jgi:hypothetical protein